MPECAICGGDNFSLMNGFYYCDECHTQSQEVRETVADEWDPSHVTVNSSRIIKSQQPRRTHSTLTEQRNECAKQQRPPVVSLIEAFNVFLCSWCDALVQLSLPASLRSIVAANWRDFLENCDGCAAGPRVTLTDCLAVLCLSLLDVDARFSPSDAVRWAREGLLPVYCAINQLPLDAGLCTQLAVRVPANIGVSSLFTAVLRVASMMRRPAVLLPSAGDALRRLCDELALPCQLVDVTLRLNGGGAAVSRHDVRVGAASRSQRLALTVPVEVTAAASLLVTLKLLLALDDLTETFISRVAAVRNRAAGGDHWFVFSDWLHYTRLRLTCVSRHHTPTMQAYTVLDPCQRAHRRLVLDFYRRDGAYRDRFETIATNKQATLRTRRTADEIGAILSDVTARAVTCCHVPGVESRGEHLWRPLSSRLDDVMCELDEQWRDALQRCCSLRNCSVQYLVDDEVIERANSQRLRLSPRDCQVGGGVQELVIHVVQGAARSRAVILRGERAWKTRDKVRVVDTACSVHCSQSDPALNTVSSIVSPADPALTLYRPCSQFWHSGKFSQDWCSTLSRSQFERVSAYWPRNFHYLFFLFARTVEMKPIDFLQIYDVIERAVFCPDIAV